MEVPKSWVHGGLAIPQNIQWNTTRRILSPLLANIYLNELDIYMEKYAEKFGKGQPKDREVDKRYQYLHLKNKKRA